MSRPRESRFLSEHEESGVKILSRSVDGESIRGLKENMKTYLSEGWSERLSLTT